MFQNNLQAKKVNTFVPLSHKIILIFWMKNITLTKSSEATYETIMYDEL